MFTGIIKNLGKIENKTKDKLTISADDSLVNKLSIGESIAVNGICLTIVEKYTDTFSIDFMPETEKRTNIIYLENKNYVNLELPATPSTFLSGHIVQGHIDTVAQIKKIEKMENSTVYTFSITKTWLKYIVSKGSVAINGVSLTVIDVLESCFTVGIIPHTYGNTTFSSIKVDDFANIEVDILAKYVERQLQK